MRLTVVFCCRRRCRRWRERVAPFRALNQLGRRTCSCACLSVGVCACGYVCVHYVLQVERAQSGRSGVKVDGEPPCYLDGLDGPSYFEVEQGGGIATSAPVYLETVEEAPRPTYVETEPDGPSQGRVEENDGYVEALASRDDLLP